MKRILFWGSAAGAFGLSALAFSCPVRPSLSDLKSHNDLRPKRFLVIGGGLAGLATARRLLHDPNVTRVTLVEQGADVATETSAKPNGVARPTSHNPSVTVATAKPLFWDKLGFSKPDGLWWLHVDVPTTVAGLVWAFWSGRGLLSAGEGELKTRQCLRSISLTGHKELTKAVKEAAGVGVCPWSRTVELFANPEAAAAAAEYAQGVLAELGPAARGASVGVNAANKAQLTTENLDIAADVPVFCRALAATLLRQHGPDRFQLLLNTSVDGVCARTGSAVEAVSLSNSAEGGATEFSDFDAVVVCAGNSSASIIQKCGGRGGVALPLQPVYGLSYDVVAPPPAMAVAHRSMSEKGAIVDLRNHIWYNLMPDQRTVRASSIAWMGARPPTDDMKREFLRRTGMNEESVSSLYSNVWTGARPSSPDDCPYVGRVPGCSNLFVNAGHGSRGFQLSFGCALFLVDQMVYNKVAQPLDLTYPGRFSPSVINPQ